MNDGLLLISSIGGLQTGLERCVSARVKSFPFGLLTGVTPFSLGLGLVKLLVSLGLVGCSSKRGSLDVTEVLFIR